MKKTKPKQESNGSRRRILKTVAGGSALSLASLPGQWAKPIVASVVLPAHAQTSPSEACVGTIANCPSGYLFNDSFSGPNTYGWDVDQVTKYNDITYTNGTLDGEAGFSTVFASGPCPEPCDVNGQKYGSYSLSFGNGSATYEGVFGIRCGDEPVIRKYYGFGGTYTYESGGTRKYAGEYRYGFEACKYFFSATANGTASMQQFGRSRRQRRFRFGR